MSEEEGVINDINPNELMSREMVPDPLFQQKSEKTDNFSIEEFIGDKTKLLNQFSVKIFKVLPIINKNHVICPLNVFSSFGKNLNKWEECVKSSNDQNFFL